jgi:hypothetical protein
MDKAHYTTVEEQVEYGLETIPEEQMVSIPLRDLMYVFETMGELNRFFHQPLNWQTLADVKTFMGGRDSGALHLIRECYYRKLRNVLPADIEAGLDADRFDNPDLPHYYKPKTD